MIRLTVKKIKNLIIHGCRGTDMIGEEMLRQGFTHVFIMTFNNREDLASYFNHPSHNDFIGTFQAALENALVFDFPAVVIKAPT